MREKLSRNGNQQSLSQLFLTIKKQRSVNKWNWYAILEQRTKSRQTKYFTTQPVGTL